MEEENKYLNLANKWVNSIYPHVSKRQKSHLVMAYLCGIYKGMVLTEETLKTIK